jgi:menaquinone-dependent protoporphyrinogen oxidase
MVLVVLVGYATDHGSTGGVADRIANRLRQRGIDARARAVADVLEVPGYEAVVLGSAIHGGKWLPEARQFADRNAAPLRERPVWLFSVSTVGDQESMFPPWVAKRLRALRKETPEMTQMRRLLHPREHRNFAGVVTRSHWSATGRAFFLATGGRYGDHRDWPAIDAWADLIASQLGVPARRATRREGGDDRCASGVKCGHCDGIRSGGTAVPG